MKSKATIIFCCGAIVTASVLIWLENKSAPQTSGEPATVGAELSVSESENLDFLRFRNIKEKFPQKSGETSLIIGGDIMLSRDVGSKMRVHGYEYPWEKVGGIISAADIAFANLENPITPGRDIGTNEMLFRADPENAAMLADVGFDILSLANNHIFNFGAKGIDDTYKYLNEAGIQYSGASEADEYAPVFAEANGQRFAFLSYAQKNFVSSGSAVAVMDIGKMQAAVRSAKDQADFVIVSMHAGSEYVEYPTDTQVDFARAAIDAGAEIVIGHHPHVAQTMEKYKDKYIFYSLGNLVFDQMWSRETRRGLMINAVFDKAGVKRIELLPVLIDDYSQPHIIDGEEATALLARLSVSYQEWAEYFWDDGFKNNVVPALVSEPGLQSYNNTKIRVRDLDNDGRLEIYALQKGVLSVQENLQNIWQSESDWWVDDFEITDANNDGSLEISMSVWRPGDYGPDMPRWETENDQSIKNHFFVYVFDNDEMKPLWQSSNLEAPNCEFEFFDIDHDGNNELIVTEGEYRDDYLCYPKYVAVWEWREWGFYNEWRGEEGITEIKK